MSVFRQVLNLFCEFGTIRGLIRRIITAKSNCSFTANLMIKIIADLAVILILIADHIVLLSKIGSYPFSERTLALCDKIILSCWIIYILSSTIFNIMDIRAIDQKKMELITSIKEKGEGYKKTEEEIKTFDVFKEEKTGIILDISINLTELPVILKLFYCSWQFIITLVE